jgi:Skp family chaperone for outer membrane proteins
MLAESERTRRQRELVETERDLQRKRREFQEDLNQRAATRSCRPSSSGPTG